MPNDERVDRVCAGINRQVAQLLASPTFLEWSRRPELQPADSGSEGDVIVFNNSFLRREGLSGKSGKYLCVSVDANGAAAILRPRRTRFDSDLVRVAAQAVAQYEITDLRSAVKLELDQLGSIVLSLVGEIGADQPASVELRSGSAKLATLRFEPDQASVATVNDDEIRINRLDDIDVVWQAVLHTIDDNAIMVSKNLPDSFKRSFGNLREEAGRVVDVNKINRNAPSILSEVVIGLDAQVQAYEMLLAKHLSDADDTEAFNEVMRVAYNFAEGGRDLIRLIVGLCDMKPVLQWLTISEQAALSRSFKGLEIAGNAKPSVEEYRSAVAGARNSAFHDLFAFGRPFRVPLRSDAFSAAELRLFREHGRGDPALNYKDRRLVELLEGFTRTDVKPVPLGFWEDNSDVMKSVAGVARAMYEALLLISPMA